jgi:hypothetical protein
MRHISTCHRLHAIRTHVTPRVRLEVFVPLQRTLGRVKTTSSLHTRRRLVDAEHDTCTTRAILHSGMIVEIEVEAKVPRHELSRSIALAVRCQREDQRSGVFVDLLEERLRFADVQLTGNTLDLYGQLIVGRVACETH